jgi:hypothetical protein
MVLYTYEYLPNHDVARYWAEMIALAPEHIANRFHVTRLGLGTNFACFSWDKYSTENTAALQAIKQVIASISEQTTGEYTFTYDPACQEDLDAVSSLRRYPPKVYCNVGLVKMMDGGECTLRLKDGPLYKGRVARAKLAERVSCMYETLFVKYYPRPGYHASMVVSALSNNAATIRAALRALPSSTVHVFYSESSVTTLWTDEGKRVWFGDMAVLEKLKDFLAHDSSEILTYGSELHVKSPDPIYKMFVCEKDRRTFLQQAHTLPDFWRDRIAVTFVKDA